MLARLWGRAKLPKKSRVTSRPLRTSKVNLPAQTSQNSPDLRFDPKRGRKIGALQHFFKSVENYQRHFFENIKF